MYRFRIFRKKIGGHQKTAAKLIIIAIIILIIAIILDNKIRPIIETVVKYNVTVVATQIINDAVYDELSKNEFTYSDFATVSIDNSNRVSSITANTVNINKVKANITRRISDSIVALDQDKIKIPIGTLLGNPIFSGRGPKVTIKILPRGYVHTKVLSKLSAAGINQTQHLIEIDITVKLSAVIPGYPINVEVPTNFPISETVIVGTVPQSFTQVLSDDEKLIGKINDYNADNYFE